MVTNVNASLLTLETTVKSVSNLIVVRQGMQ